LNSPERQRAVSLTSLTFYFDFISPYAYLAWTQIHALAERYGRVVEPAPVLFAALLDANGQRGPAEIPRKRMHVFADCARTAHRLGVPIEPPPAHPFNPLLGLRAASLPMEAAERRALVDGLFAATWRGGGGITEQAAVASIASKAGLDGARVVAAATSPEAKDTVRRRTAEALEAGAFGVPTMIVDGQLFWGFDSFANLELVLAGRDPLDAATLARWKDLPAAAVRPGSK
jgi:2-hydroxychromene-2-carboxylate isomerase